MATDNLARGMAASKLSKTGGTISGNLTVTGDLNVNGTTVTTKQETLLVRKNMLVTNADGIPLVGMSGLGIRDGSTDVYGLVFDPVTDSVKFGLGTLDSNNNFTFNTNEGQPIAIRADSNMFVDGHYVKWDSTKNMFVDGGASSGWFPTSQGTWNSAVEYSVGAVVLYSLTYSNSTYTFKYISIVDNNINHAPSSNINSLDNQYWICLTNDAVTSAKTRNVYVDRYSTISSQAKYGIMLSDGVIDDYSVLGCDATGNNYNVYVRDGELCDKRGRVASDLVFGISEGSYISNGQTLYINTDIPVSVVVDFLSNLELTESIEIEETPVDVSAILFEDASNNTEGIYMADLSVLGGTGYIIFLAKVIGTATYQYEKVLFVSDVSDPTNETLIQTFFPTFTMPLEAGWTEDSVMFTTNSGPFQVLRSQQSSIIAEYSKYIAYMFTLDKTLHDMIKFMIDYSVTTALNTPV